MAAAFRRCQRPILLRLLSTNRQIHSQSVPHTGAPLALICGVTAGATLAWYIASKNRNLSVNEPILAKETESETGNVTKAVVQTQRELRFLSFASVEYEGNVYMTPQDFLESAMEEAPRPRTGRARLRKSEVDAFLKTTPARYRGSSSMFRDLMDRGLISYTEYLFLVCVLTKPRSGFRIAFNMFDTDGNQRVDKKEFLVLQQVLAGDAKGADGKNLSESDNKAPVDTTLMVHFFGKKGNEVLKYEDFSRFMENLQTEVLSLEFNEFARGMPTITEEEFAEVLLRYTILSKEDQEEYISRLRSRIPDTKGITFQDFKEFGTFLNNLDDFAIAMKMYTFADQPISEDEFKRAVKICTGQKLNDHLVHVVFQLFDIDGDGELSHKEFISVMRDRLHRGTKTSQMHQTQWETFKSCVKNEMRNA